MADVLYNLQLHSIKTINIYHIDKQLNIWEVSKNAIPPKTHSCLYVYKHRILPQDCHSLKSYCTSSHEHHHLLRMFCTA